jgi:hypothetical protein
MFVWIVEPPSDALCTTFVCAGWSTSHTVGVGVGGGIGAALLLAGCVFIGKLISQRRRSPGRRVQRPDPFTMPTKGAQSVRLRYGAQKDPSPHTDTDVTNPCTWRCTHNSHCGPPSLELPSGTTMASSSLDLIKDGQTESDLPGLSAPTVANNRGEGMYQEGLQPQGLDPGDVLIAKDSRGKAVVLGWGPHAIVYLGFWQQRSLAVSVMLPRSSDDAQQKTREDSDKLCALRHPNIVSPMGVCTSPNGQVQSLPPQDIPFAWVGRGYQPADLV